MRIGSLGIWSSPLWTNTTIIKERKNMMTISVIVASTLQELRKTEAIEARLLDLRDVTRLDGRLIVFSKEDTMATSRSMASAFAYEPYNTEPQTEGD